MIDRIFLAFGPFQMKGPNYRPEGVQAHPEPEQNINNPVNPVER
jgi:hypothetical protein